MCPLARRFRHSTFDPKENPGGILVRWISEGPRPRYAPGPGTPDPVRQRSGGVGPRLSKVEQDSSVSPSRSTIGVALATIAVLWLAPSAAHVAPRPPVALIVGLALLFGPGWLALRAAGSIASFSPGALPAALLFFLCPGNS